MIFDKKEYLFAYKIEMIAEYIFLWLNTACFWMYSNNFIGVMWRLKELKISVAFHSNMRIKRSEILESPHIIGYYSQSDNTTNMRNTLIDSFLVLLLIRILYYWDPICADWSANKSATQFWIFTTEVRIPVQKCFEVLWKKQVRKRLLALCTYRYPNLILYRPIFNL